MKSIHARIRQRRDDLGLSQQQLADLVGVSYQAVQQWEREPVAGDDTVQSTAPKRARLEKVARVLKCTPEWLLTGRMLDPSEMDPEQAMRFDMYRKLPDHLRRAVDDQITLLYNLSHPDKPHPADPFGGKKPPE